VIFTLNEEVNLPHCLASLAWCDDVVVVDSFSSDRTESIAREAGVRFVQHAFTGFGDQRNWVFDAVPLKHAWALVLDADERVPPELAAELGGRLRDVSPEVAAFRVRRRFHLWGRWLRWSSLYPTWVVRLVRVGRVRYISRGHAETQRVDGRVDALAHDLVDENHKGLDEWWARQARYAAQEAEHELSQPAVSPWALLSRNPLRRRSALKSLAGALPGRHRWYFLYAYFLRLGFLDGRDGFRFCRMKAAYQKLIARNRLGLRRQSLTTQHSPLTAGH
jgi:glycosyltransferase involved in cell wall biosynthesis